MPDQLTTIIEALRRIQTEGGAGNFAIIAPAEKAHYYIQFACARGSAQLYAEAVCNDYLDADSALDEMQIARLGSLGWSPPGSGYLNFYREWQAARDDQRQEVAQAARQAFIEVYRITPDSQLNIEMVLE